MRALNYVLLGSGAAAASPTLILDQFTDTNGTALSSHTIAPTNTPATSWTLVAGTWQIQSNKAKVTTASGGQDIAVVDAGMANVTVTVTIVVDAESGIIANYQDSTHYFLARFTPAATNADLLINDGGISVLATSSIPIVGGNTYVAKVVTSGDNLKVYVDDVLAIDYTSVGRLFKTATKFGVRSFSDITTTFDNFTVATS